MTLLHEPGTVDPAHWPDVAAVPDSPARAAIAARLWRHAVNRLPLRVEEPGGRVYGGGDHSAPHLNLVRPRAFFQRLGKGGTIGFGEAYMAGDWTTDDLTGVVAAFAAHMRELVPATLGKLRHAVLRRQPSSEDNTIEGARENIHRHYDLSNDLFAAFLDPSMTYSSAYFGDEYPDGDLAEAQHRKIDRLLDVADVKRGSRILEIGTGWGELAIRAARRGAHVTTLTISTEQAELARRRIGEAGVSDLVDVQLRDYRDAEGRFDAVMSVEMIEAVGANHWDEYFTTIDRSLLPGGKVGLQAILQDDADLLRTQDTYTWIRKYIFPGGQLLSVPAIERVLERATSLRVVENLQIGRHYAETLRRWRTRFEANSERIGALGFDQTFQRMWSLYLAYCEAGFATGYLNVSQLCLSRD